MTSLPQRVTMKKAAAVDKAVVAKQTMSAKDAAPAKATKEQAAVQIWPGVTSDSAPAGQRLGSAWTAQAAPLEPLLPPVALASRHVHLCGSGLCATPDGHASLPCWMATRRIPARWEATHPCPAGFPQLNFRRRSTLRAFEHSCSLASPPPSMPPSSRA